MKRFGIFSIVATLLLTLASCSDLEDLVVGESTIKKGEEIQFTTLVPEVSLSRTAKADWETQVHAYKPLSRDYKLNIEMWKEGGTQALGSAVYVRDGENLDNVFEDNAQANAGYDGTLRPEDEENKLYWEDNVSRWGFKATAGTETLEGSQTNQSEWLAQDKLVGYSYLPIWDETNQKGTDDFDAINYRTPHQWYEDNKTAQTLSGLMSPQGSDGSEYKKIPLYMQHERAWITVILRAAEGVSREALYFDTSEQNIHATVYSYDENSQKLDIPNPWSHEAFIDYPKDKNGEAKNNVSTTRYDAIVDPFDYTTHPDNPMFSIVLSSLKFNYLATNDSRFVSHGSDTESDEYKKWKSIYNLQKGKHLTIEATLSRETLKILITAWIEDWTEAVTTTICDDYGQNGDPVVIYTRQGLIDFLKSSDNAAGTVAIIQPTSLDLDSWGELDADKGKIWNTLLSDNNFELKATLNMAGSVIKSSSQFVKNIAASGSIINGTIQLKENAMVETAICDKNYGTLERMKVVPEAVSTAGASKAKATKAGLVNMNYGTIYLCSSELRVYGESGFVGGIAAQSLYPNETVMPVIDACTVNASVNGADGVKGGGIAGNTAGRVTNCTFEYGITLNQKSDNFKNICGAKVPDKDLRAYNNGWPTTAENTIGSGEGQNENVYAKQKNDAVINCEEELGVLLTSQYNLKENNYRISEDFKVSSDTWNNKGKVDDDRNATENGNVFFTLYGNNKKITLTGNKEVNYYSGQKSGDGDLLSTVQTAPMLFTNVMGKIYDLNIYLEKPVVSEPSESTTMGATTYSGVDAIAPLAYSVYGGDALISNVRVTAGAGAYVQSATPGGLVVWAYGTKTSYPTIENCVVNTPVRMWLPYTWTNTEAKQYAGGIVSMASVAQITQCQYLNSLSAAISDEDFRAATHSTGRYPANGTMCFYGGIVGGTTYVDNRFDEKFAELTITDCSSWYNVPEPCSHGSIIGYVLYSDGTGSSILKNGMAEGNTGNWWPEGSYAISNFSGNPTEEKAVGRRNNVTPQQRTN